MIKTNIETLKQILKFDNVVDFYVNDKMVTIYNAEELDAYKDQELFLYPGYIRYLKNKFGGYSMLELKKEVGTTKQQQGSINLEKKNNVSLRKNLQVSKNYSKQLNKKFDLVKHELTLDEEFEQHMKIMEGSCYGCEGCKFKFYEICPYAY